MRSRRLLLSVTIGLVLLPVVTVAQTTTMSATAGWIAAPAAGATSTAVYVELQNPTMYDVYIVEATTDAAGSVELRDGADAKVVKELTVSAFGALSLKPGAAHLVLKDLKKPLQAGDTVDLLLKTDGGALLKVAAAVR